MEARDRMTPQQSANFLMASFIEPHQQNEMQCFIGGGEFHYIPALNDDPLHVQALTRLITTHCQGWPEFSPDYDAAAAREELQHSKARADQLAGES